MMNRRPLSGVIVAALTPLHDDFSLALENLPPYLEFLAGRGCQGALLLGTTGEGPSFALKERHSILQTALQVRQIYPDFVLLAGTGTPSLEESVELTRNAFDLGYNGVVVLPPYYFRGVSEEGLFAWFSQLIQRAVPKGGALLGYHIPQVSGVPLSLDLLARLIDAYPESFAGLKDSSGDPDHARRLGARFGENLRVFTGNDTLFSLALENSACGCITAMANLRSRDLRLVWDAHQRGEQDVEAQCRLSAAREVMGFYAPFPPLYKSLLPRLHGFPNWTVRPPLTPLSSQEAEQALREAQEAVEVFAY